ncbi:MAG: hypothetical protein QME45_06495 [Clostridiales bacterium]|nr:hypothetical protein [Clostridiales bacterium]
MVDASVKSIAAAFPRCTLSSRTVIHLIDAGVKPVHLTVNACG